ncbi:MAG: hypothetical protein FXF47_02580 [Candidatus Mcinerneyibacterium aminivorans]|uniref:Alanyl-transfer RNA synthetases family profile domain-containing protein n=1 Tax=Candidatus Mcinerneyibacterium aminivorans TaxID=2703815 RepID=A0A5D0MFG5_9BACT|nr:MAG: hypothetical protein FXF47_02580 [Candidatus Mcinerneyibacterium aminivorans]
MALYHENAYVKKFKTNISKIIKFEDTYGLILEKTYFYPESGGQLADKGKINNIDVINVIKRNDEIVHIVKNKPKSESVECYINWDRRYDFMQQHTGQHLLSAVIDDKYQSETVSFHMSEEYSFIDIDIPKLGEKTIKEIENEVNSLIWENKVINTFWIDPDKIDSYDIRKQGKYDEKIRMVEIEDVDLSMCGGTHVSEICEIGMLKITNAEKVKENTFRIYFRCGRRALQYFQSINIMINNLSSILSVKRSEIVKMAKKFKKDRENYYHEIENLKERLIDEKLKNIKTNSRKIVYDTVNDIDNNALNYYANQILQTNTKIAILYDTVQKFLLIRQKGNEYNLKEIGNSIISRYSAKGGGSELIFQIVNIEISNLKNEIIERYIK